MPKKDQNKTKSKSVIVKGTITDSQKKAIQNLIGLLGNNEQDVVGKIITLWLYNEGFLNKQTKEKK
jgi:hypothetical protein